MSPDVVFGLFVAITAGMIGQSWWLWRRLGNIETALKRSCPFGECPIYERAKQEAAQKRTIKVEGA